MVRWPMKRLYFAPTHHHILFADEIPVLGRCRSYSRSRTRRHIAYFPKNHLETCADSRHHVEFERVLGLFRRGTNSSFEMGQESNLSFFLAPSLEWAHGGPLPFFPASFARRRSLPDHSQTTQFVYKKPHNLEHVHRSTDRHLRYLQNSRSAHAAHTW